MVQSTSDSSGGIRQRCDNKSCIVPPRLQRNHSTTVHLGTIECSHCREVVAYVQPYPTPPEEKREGGRERLRKAGTNRVMWRHSNLYKLRKYIIFSANNASVLVSSCRRQRPRKHVDNHWLQNETFLQIEGPMVEVLCVDDGNRENVGLSRLRPLEEKFLKLPCQALCCALSGVRPVNTPQQKPGTCLH